jgi:hypothetical protein
MKRFTRDYILKEAEYCKEELEKFYSDPTEENRQIVLKKREEFKLMYEDRA